MIVITSEKPVGDPALDLLLELNWSSGKLLREYSVLLDPPGMPAAATRNTAVATSAASSRKPATTRPTARTRPRKAGSQGQRQAAPRHRRPAPIPPSIEMGSQYTAQSGDNVWSIARRSTARAGNINRMMVAIQRANPDAFYKDNINALKKGAVLRIPDRADMDQINARRCARRGAAPEHDMEQPPCGGSQHDGRGAAALPRPSSGNRTARVRESPRPGSTRGLGFFGRRAQRCCRRLRSGRRGRSSSRSCRERRRSWRAKSSAVTTWRRASRIWKASATTTSGC